ncbi:cysteine desulfurase [Alteribacillus persepolensis]|uniref:Cysteine desulfurase n=1 Tax=Alteribacillus persepolensis TaxID=568899 RepID=A0A1G8BFQ9_9BACI|nr:cysteine desulfurase family protein [Alteribacillus persepolensis]SDH31853.1 cysteine desulfurase [Alteribacillus persepolensis]
MVYLDNSATTLPWQEVLDTYQQAASAYFGNPSSLHRPGVEAETLLGKAREAAASILKVKSSEVIFTSGGTEGNNLAIKGTAVEHQNRGKHLITSAVEHPSALEAFAQLEAFGYEVTYLPVNKEGRIRPEDVENAVREDTTLVSIIHVNNETGTIQPIEEIGKRLAAYPKLYFHTDHVQGAAHVPLDLGKANVDLCTISAHKFHGLKGTGMLYIKDGTVLSPLFHGGGQEQKIRAGTENVPGIAAMAKALRLAREQHTKEAKRMYELQKYLLQELEKIDGAQVNTPQTGAAPHIVNVSFPGLKPEVIIQALTKRDIHVSTKSACSSKLNEPSHVIEAAGLGQERADSAIRISFSFETIKEEIEKLIDVFHEIIPEMKKVMGA